jgi:hypothetical protein
VPFSAFCRGFWGPSRRAHAAVCRPLPPQWPCKWPCNPAIMTVCGAGRRMPTPRPERAGPERTWPRPRAPRTASPWGTGRPGSMLRALPITSLSLPISPSPGGRGALTRRDTMPCTTSDTLRYPGARCAGSLSRTYPCLSLPIVSLEARA